MSSGNPIIYLRVPFEVRDAIRRSAEENGRTMTGEVVYQLRKAYDTSRKEKDAPET